MFCSAKSDSLSTEFACLSGISRRVGVCSDLEHTAVVSPVHELFKSFVEARSLCRDLAEKNFARAAVYRNPVALFKNEIACFYRLFVNADVESAASADTAFAHASCNNGSV